MTRIQRAKLDGLELIAQNKSRYVFEGEEKACLQMAHDHSAGEARFIWEADEEGDINPILPYDHARFTWGASMFPIGGGLYHLAIDLY